MNYLGHLVLSGQDDIYGDAVKDLLILSTKESILLHRKIDDYTINTSLI